MNRTIQFSPDEYYHLYARGIEKRQIFQSPSDYWRFMMLLYVANTSKPIHLSDYSLDNPSDIFALPKDDSIVDIGAYCLMPNHFHLLVKEKDRKDDESGISYFMQKLSTGYSMFFNKKNKRTGGLFERPFKARHVASDEYLRYLFAYIHLNPVKTTDPEGWGGKKINNPTKAARFLDQFRFSSYQFYMGQSRSEDTILEPEVFPEYFADFKDFKQFVDEWIEFDGLES